MTSTSGRVNSPSQSKKEAYILFWPVSIASASSQSLSLSVQMSLLPSDEAVAISYMSMDQKPLPVCNP